MVHSLYFEVSEVSEAENCRGLRYNSDVHCVKNPASYSLYSGRYDPSKLEVQPLPESILKLDTWGKFYILGYKGPNGIPKDVPEISRTVISMVRNSKPEDEPVTCGMPYNFTVLNSPVTCHLGKRIINPNW